MLKKISYPPFVFGGIKPNHRAHPLESNLRLFGADTETYYGDPHTLQIYDGRDLFFEYVNAGTIFKRFTEYLFERSRDRGVNICYIHFLRFDLPVIFHEKRLAIYEQISEIEFDFRGYHCELLFGKVNKITMAKKGRTVHVFDSWSFTQASLARSLQMYKIDAAKLEKSPALEKAIGRTQFDKLPVNSPLRLEFEKYAKVDATSEYKLGGAIMGFHKKYGVRPCISLPQFASRVFRHHFFKKDETIPFPPTACVSASERSYHGGKNGYYLEKPQVIENAYELDISSAYPYAMTKIPQMVSGQYLNVDKYYKGFAGVYQISGKDNGRYPLVYNDVFEPVRGDFKDLWMTSYELERALKSKDVDLEIKSGWVWNPDPTQTHNPMRRYVDHFYKLKEQTPKDDPNYYFYKIMLNGLYGKFVQTTDIQKLIELPDEKKKNRRLVADYTWDKVLGKFVKLSHDHRAGGLYNPFIASLITGYVRAMLYDLETQYKGFHSATDAIKTQSRVAAIKGLGGLKIETFGRCYAFRNKLYLHFAKDSKYCGHDLKTIKIFDDDGQHLCKYGLHGFKGRAEDLFKARHALLAGEGYSYEYQHMVGLREGFRRREQICSMITRKETIKL